MFNQNIQSLSVLYIYTHVYQWMIEWMNEWMNECLVCLGGFAYNRTIW